MWNWDEERIVDTMFHRCVYPHCFRFWGGWGWGEKQRKSWRTKAGNLKTCAKLPKMRGRRTWGMPNSIEKTIGCSHDAFRTASRLLECQKGSPVYVFGRKNSGLGLHVGAAGLPLCYETYKQLTKMKSKRAWRKNIKNSKAGWKSLSNVVCLNASS